MPNDNKKFSLSLTSKSSQKPNFVKPSKTFTENGTTKNDENSDQEYVTEFDTSAIRNLSRSSESNTKKIIIPPKENEFNPYKRMKNIDLPLWSTSNGVQELSFELESQGHGEDTGVNMSYGLNLRRSEKEQNENVAVDVDVASDDHRKRESTDSIMLKKLKDDMERLPDDEGFEQFEEVPVDGFGAALMAGYGWKEGMGIGKNAKEDVKVVEYKQRNFREGLGVSSDVPKMNGNKVSQDVSVDEDKQKRRLENNGKKMGYPLGQEVRIIRGRDVGLKGRVLKMSDEDAKLVLELSQTEERVKVYVNDVTELGSIEETKCLRKLKELKTQAGKDVDGREDREAKHSSSHRRDKERKESKKRSREERNESSGNVKTDTTWKKEESRSMEKRSNVSWLRSHIRVRIVSKDFKGGRLYLKKGEVLDVVGPTTCDVSMDSSREIIQGVDQDLLETALPRRGGRVLVLLGRHKGVFGSLVEKDSEKETGIIQNADTQELVTVKLEQIAEYVGDPSDFEY